MNPEDRMRVMEQCMVLPGSGWVLHFGLMMTMSVIVAIMGLSANSAALVIGAMLIAPLMTPVLGIAAAIAMALGDATMRAAFTVWCATVGAILVSYLIAGALPGELLTDEVLARTAPDARDLVVALAAGVAGSYATARPDVSSSLPGVAIAVALVPPLAVVGITLRAGETDLALGALLLYATNLAAIVTVSSIIFVVAGFVPGRRLLSMAPRVIAGSLLALIVVVILGVLLGSRSYESAQRSAQVTQIRAAAATWLEDTFNESDVQVDGINVDITVTGPTEIPPSEGLSERIADILDQEPVLKVTWIQGQTSESLNANRQLQAQTAEQAAARELRAETIDATVLSWLGSDGDASIYELTDLEIGEQSVTVSVSSTVSPPDLGDLESRLEQALGEDLDVAVQFDDQSTAESQRANTEATGLARIIVQDFAVDQGLTVDDVTFDGTNLVVDLRGEVLPVGTELGDSLIEALGEEVTIRVFFIERVPVIPAPTPTATPTPEPTAVPTPTPEPTPAPDAAEDPDTTPDPDATTEPDAEPDN